MNKGAKLYQINSYTNWGKLNEVWLGDVYPASWYEHLDPRVRDVFQEITEKTKEDLSVIQRSLEALGIVVQRPTYDNIDNFIDINGHLRKPSITPRDEYLVAGKTMFGFRSREWAPVIDTYTNFVNKETADSIVRQFNSANTVRIGRDIYLDWGNEPDDLESFVEYFQETELFNEHRVHLLFNGGHIDGCFAAVKPGLILASRYYQDYENTFPGWSRIEVSRPEFQSKRRSGPGVNGKWWNTGIVGENKTFNQYIIQHALDWVGDYTETFFEINCLVIDDKNVFMVGENEQVFRELERYGVTAHAMPFRTRTFWDGGLHCLTVDINRSDSIVDLFPERTEKLYVWK
jgi:hypothetical protein